MKEEIITKDRVVWNSETAKNYRCPFCGKWIRSQYEGIDLPLIFCEEGQHRLQWVEDPVNS